MNTGHYDIRDAHLTQRIMRRVYFNWFMRRVVPTLLGQFAVLALLLVGIHEYVSVRFVLKNALTGISGIPSLVDFIAVGFANTGFVPQILFGATFLLGVMMLRDLMKAARGMPRRQLEFIRQ